MDKKIKEFVSKIKKEHDDDVVDRANYATTVYLLGFFAMLIMAKQYVGEPLQCWIPAEYKDQWEKYIESYCFIENTYYGNGTIPEKQMRSQNELRYYQWVPYILAAQALICYAPKFIHKMLYSFSDLRVNDIVGMVYSERKKALKDKKAITQMDIGEAMYTKVANILDKRNLADDKKLQCRFNFLAYTITGMERSFKSNTKTG
uniref:Innexin n=1 Tax=Acrobeloides nanus TaxID=290746 RepID=A0A914D1Q7_9BILA